MQFHIEKMVDINQLQVTRELMHVGKQLLIYLKRQKEGITKLKLVSAFFIKLLFSHQMIAL